MANQPSVQTLERGSIYFFYQPKAGERQPRDESDIQSLYMVLSPDEKPSYRLAFIGQKELPNPQQSGHRRYWGTVTMVTREAKQVRDELGPREYSTKTGGKRHIGAAQPAGEGVYRIALHDGHTHLVYALELPREPGPVQEELDIKQEASYIITVRNPATPSRFRGRSTEEAARYPQSLADKFRDRRFSELDPVDFINYAGAEFALIAVSGDGKENLGIQLQAESEIAASADIFKDLQIDRSRRPTKPLFEGEWE